MKHLEVKTIEHNGIKVMIKLDYEKGTASLVEMLHANNDVQYKSKSWVFTGRTLDYMNGWLKILEAMTVAVKECKKSLEQELAEKSKFTDKVLANIAIHDLKSRSKGKNGKKDAEW